MGDLEKILGRTGQSDDSPPGADARSDITGPIIDERRDFRTTALGAGMNPARKSESQGEPYSKPYRISAVYEVAPVGGSGAQFTAVAGEGNGRFSAPLDFEAHSIIVDNWSAQYLYFPSANRWVAPYQIDKILPVPRGTTTIDVKFIAPGGLALPAVVANHFASIQAYEGLLTFSTGFDVNAIVGSGVERTDVEQIAGISIASDGAGTQTVGVKFSGVAQTWAQFGSGDGIGTGLVSQPSSTPGSAQGTAAAATITFAAVAGQQHRITSVAAGYAAVASTATTSTVTVSDGTSSLIYNVPTAVGTGGTSIPVPPGGIKFLVNTTVTVILVSGVAAGSVGSVNASKLTA